MSRLGLLLPLGAVLLVAAGSVLWLVREDGSAVRPRPPEPVPDGRPQPEFVERQKLISRLVTGGQDPRSTARDLSAIGPFSEYEQRRIVSLLSTYRPEEARAIGMRLLEVSTELRGGYFERWTHLEGAQAK